MESTSSTSGNQQFSTLNRYRREHLRVDVFLVSGVRLTGRIKSFDQYTMLLDTGEGDAVVYHHAVSSIGRSLGRGRRPGPARESAPRRDGEIRDTRFRSALADPRTFESRGPRELRPGWESGEARESREPPETLESRDPRELRQPREPRADRPRSGGPAPEVVVIRRRSRLTSSS